MRKKNKKNKSLPVTAIGIENITLHKSFPALSLEWCLKGLLKTMYGLRPDSINSSTFILILFAVIKDLYLLDFYVT